MVVAIAILENLLPLNTSMGLVAGGLLAYSIHKAPGVGIAFGFAAVLIGVALLHGSVDEFTGVLNGAMAHAKENEDLCRGLALGTLGYGLYATGWMMGGANSRS